MTDAVTPATLRALPALPGSTASGLLARALDILSHLAHTLPPGALDVQARSRIQALFSDAAVASEDSRPTQTAGEKLLPLYLSPPQHRVLETALLSGRLNSTFTCLHDFILLAAERHVYAPPPAMQHVSPMSKEARQAVVPFTEAELVQVRERASIVGVTVERFLLGCAFACLAHLQSRWPNDALLNALPAPPSSVSVHLFPETKKP